MLSIEGFAIVSANGMLAASDGFMPNSLKFEEDQQFLDEALDAAALLVHGRISHEMQENSHKRRRLLLTRKTGAFSDQPVEPNVWLWNPSATPFAEVCERLAIDEGVVAVLGGTAAYDLFLADYAKFHLCRADKVVLPGGVPVLTGVGDDNPPDNVLRGAGLTLAKETALNPEAGLRQQLWVRRAS
jgi:hypothetical protein